MLPDDEALGDKNKEIKLKDCFSHIIEKLGGKRINENKIADDPIKKAPDGVSSGLKSSEHIFETHLDKLKKNFKVFQGEYKVQNYKTHYFMIFELLRQVSISIVIAALQPWPLAQTILILLSNILFLLGYNDNPSIHKFEVIYSKLRS